MFLQYWPRLQPTLLLESVVGLGVAQPEALVGEGEQMGLYLRESRNGVQNSTITQPAGPTIGCFWGKVSFSQGGGHFLGPVALREPKWV